MRALKKLLPVVAAAFLMVIVSCGSEESITAVDTVPPIAPVGMALDEESYHVCISWAENAEPDLAGYNLYSSSNEEGPYSKVNYELLLCPWYYDAPTPMDMTYYKVTAVDQSGNESAYSDIMGIYFNIIGDRNTPSTHAQ
jgi:fibronectin type 3 domain-containing protein